ncbi:unnamed protein product [Dovyalis caffra]|uniref:Uncharacterized protein n=1 Tax=Dovyalis caffra TaxID=77055 RepID=A0AAV1RRP8_9ROSI|nr:unnamed protein product [Dovyalis caffra]
MADEILTCGIFSWTCQSALGNLEARVGSQKYRGWMELLKDFAFLYIILMRFFIESGLMTPTMKIRRDKVAGLYEEQIANLYK